MELELGTDSYFVPSGMGFGELRQPESSTFEGESQGRCGIGFKMFAGSSNKLIRISFYHL